MSASFIQSTLPNSLDLRVIHPARYVSQLAQVKFAAFQQNALNSKMYPLALNERGTVTWLEEREAQDLASNKITTVAIIDTISDEILARAKWRVPGKHTVSDAVCTDYWPAEISYAQESRKTPERSFGLPQYPEGSDLSLQNSFRAILQQKRELYYDSETDYFIGALYTHPRHQGRGCATALLSWGIQQADANRAKIYLESTPSAHGLYLKAGWKDVDQFTIDLSCFGGNGVYHGYIMVRYPASTPS